MDAADCDVCELVADGLDGNSCQDCDVCELVADGLDGYSCQDCDVCELVAGGGRGTEHRQPGTASAASHARMMRTTKALNAAARAQTVAPYVQSRIDGHNVFLATRPSEVIGSLNARRAPLVPGRGRHKHWVPAAALRVCFQPPRPRYYSHRRVRKPVGLKRIRAAGSNPMATSSRATAHQMRTGVTYLQKVRNAMALRVFKRQGEQLSSRAPASHAIFELQAA